MFVFSVQDVEIPLGDPTVDVIDAADEEPSWDALHDAHDETLDEAIVFDVGGAIAGFDVDTFRVGDDAERHVIDLDAVVGEHAEEGDVGQREEEEDEEGGFRFSEIPEGIEEDDEREEGAPGDEHAALELSLCILIVVGPQDVVGVDAAHEPHSRVFLVDEVFDEHSDFVECFFGIWARRDEVVLGEIGGSQPVGFVSIGGDDLIVEEVGLHRGESVLPFEEGLVGLINGEGVEVILFLISLECGVFEGLEAEPMVMVFCEGVVWEHGEDADGGGEEDVTHIHAPERHCD